MRYNGNTIKLFCGWNVGIGITCEQFQIFLHVGFGGGGGGGVVRKSQLILVML